MFYNFKGNELDLSSFDFSSLKTADKIFAGTTNGLVIYLKNEEQQNKLNAIITQNIDGLDYEAGSKNVFELHGSIKRNY